MTIEEVIRIATGLQTDFKCESDTMVDFCNTIIKALEQEPCEDYISRNAIIQTLNNMDRYVANELILRDTNNKFPQNEVFIVDDVYEQIAEQLSSVTPQQKIGHCKDCKWWKDEDGVYRRGFGAKSKCPINHKEVYEGNGYCIMFEPKMEEVEE